jgi:hypothetical protein
MLFRESDQIVQMLRLWVQIAQWRLSAEARFAGDGRSRKTAGRKAIVYNGAAKRGTF